MDDDFFLLAENALQLDVAIPIFLENQSGMTQANAQQNISAMPFACLV
jgi:hypothetical protein